MTLPTSCILNLCSLFSLFYMKTYPFIAGYSTCIGLTCHIHENAVRTTVSFRGTSQSDVQSNNDLFAGMFVTGFSSADLTDYGFRAEAVLPVAGSTYLVAQVIETCEAPGCAIGGLSPHWKLLNQTEVPLSFSASDNVTLEMKWSSGTVTWYYQVNGGTNSSYHSYTMPSDSRHYFVIGTTAPPNDYVRYFYFGIESQYNIGNTGWKVGIYNPQYSNGTGTWTSVAQADSSMGNHAYYDYIIRWDGGAYTGVLVCYADSMSCSFPSDY